MRNQEYFDCIKQCIADPSFIPVFVDELQIRGMRGAWLKWNEVWNLLKKNINVEQTHNALYIRTLTTYCRVNANGQIAIQRNKPIKNRPGNRTAYLRMKRLKASYDNFCRHYEGSFLPSFEMYVEIYSRPRRFPLSIPVPEESV